MHKVTKDIPIPADARLSAYDWQLEEFTEFGHTRFYPDKTKKQAEASIQSFRNKSNGMHKNKKFTARDWQEAEEVGGKKVRGVRIWRTDKPSEHSQVGEKIEDEKAAQRVTTTDVRRSLTP